MPSIRGHLSGEFHSRIDWSGRCAGWNGQYAHATDFGETLAKWGLSEGLMSNFLWVPLRNAQPLVRYWIA